MSKLINQYICRYSTDTRHIHPSSRAKAALLSALLAVVLLRNTMLVGALHASIFAPIVEKQLL